MLQCKAYLSKTNPTFNGDAVVEYLKPGTNQMTH